MRGRPKKETAPEAPPDTGVKEQEPNTIPVVEDIVSVQQALEAANKRIAELEKEEEIIVIMDRQAPFKVIYGKVLTVNKKKQAVPKGARYFQYGAYFNLGGKILKGQKVVIPERPKNIRIIGRM